jgi:hypothetical protein
MILRVSCYMNMVGTLNIFSFEESTTISVYHQGRQCLFVPTHNQILPYICFYCYTCLLRGGIYNHSTIYYPIPANNIRSHDGVAREQSDAAEAGRVAGVALHENVAVLAPPLPPRVLDDPVLLPWLRSAVAVLIPLSLTLTVPDHRDAVVHVGGAGPREHPASVELEHEAAAVNGHGHRLRGGGTQELRLAVGRHVPVRGDGHRALLQLRLLALVVQPCACANPTA